ncbi:MULTISPECIES: type III secretion system cytoplasmic ring protein SctQ [Burkholderia]|uniref:type III secretion system cytoplasmic ring protein SctQ n=1 Tax=Burkholderia TaxID=32008 RepID=UPI00075698AD|nr:MULTISPECIES: type III secretion system cytoplasmic ring protein SctQ [Burkholderia]AOJ73538.1 type III secretion system protein [Burkholderia savannae]KVG38919.1 type III secretion system protein [Burkholderia sp. MSMB0265]KVG81645.1 type III secretion system protein [Burkholderia sp. MSMB2040]KVG98802.1 type III secretion system protein [Burkholderia sp. MSMB2042]KVG98983.1 type III secretion system protein [Burkholderia sp. MSMB2041]
MSARYLSLRCVETTQLPLYQSARALSAVGHHAALRVIAPPCGYAVLRAFWKGMEYEGWVDIDDLMRRHYPALATLAWRALDKHYALALLGGRDAATDLPAPPGGWEHVRLVDLVERELHAEPLLCFDAVDGVRSMFRTFPDAAPAGRAVVDMAKLPVVMCFVIGVSRLPHALLSAIVPGDVLLVCEPRNVVRIGAKSLCEFRWKGEEIMLDEQIVENTFDDVDEERIEVDALADAPPKSFEIDALPVTLEFSLPGERMTVAQLAGCHAGTVLPLRGTSRDVTIRANGQPLGQGELIQVGEQLAVEVKTLWFTKPAASDGE